MKTDHLFFGLWHWLSSLNVLYRSSKASPRSNVFDPPYFVT
jgi:hypothetical protein